MPLYFCSLCYWGGKKNLLEIKRNYISKSFTREWLHLQSMLFPENWSSASLISTCQESLWTFRTKVESWWNAGNNLVSMILDAKNMRCSMITCTHRQRTTEVRLKAFALKKTLWVLSSAQNIPMSLRAAGEQGKQLNGLFMMVLNDLSDCFGECW